MAQDRATKSAAAKILRISRRTVQRYCQLYASFGSPITDEKGKIDPAELWQRIQSIKVLERRGFPLGAKRRRDLFSVKRTPKAFGRSFVERQKFIGTEIDAMTDGQQVMLLLSWLQGAAATMFRPGVREKAREIAELLRSKGNHIA